MMIRYSCDRHVIRGRPPAAESGIFLHIEFELMESGFYVFLGEGGGDVSDIGSSFSKPATDRGQSL
jgi:hypothetical protein